MTANSCHSRDAFFQMSVFLPLLSLLLIRCLGQLKENKLAAKQTSERFGLFSPTAISDLTETPDAGCAMPPPVNGSARWTQISS